MNAPALHWIHASEPADAFPDIDFALREPNGLLAAGGDLSQERLLYAYRHGIFPWFDDGQPILWWSPDPRCVLVPRNFHASRRLKRHLRKRPFQVSFNRCFDDVVAACAMPRPGQPGTWITGEMAIAYGRLHADAWAHSVEVWQGERLVGGLYGVAIGRVFFGESMFSRHADASKAALLHLCRTLSKQDFLLLDCQVVSRHLQSLGATLLSRSDFRGILAAGCPENVKWEGAPSTRLPLEAPSGD